MQHLEHYLEKTNRLLKIFNDEIFVLPLSQERYEDLVRILGNAMSPENLTCDGEAVISSHFIMKRLAYYKAVEEELQNHARGLGLATMEVVA